MTRYRMQAPDGHTYVIDGPAGASDAQVRAAIIAQNPHLAALTAPAAKPSRPILTVRPPSQPAQPAQPQSSVLGSIWRGVQDAVPGISYIDAAGRQAGNYIGGALGGHADNVTYAQRVRQVQQERAAQEAADAAQNPVSHYGAEIGGAIGSGIAGGGLAKLGAGALGAASNPAVASVGNFLQRLATLKKGQTGANLAKAAVQGGAAGAVYGAGSADPDHIGAGAGYGAATGAVLAPALATAAGAIPGVVRSLSRPYSNSLAKALQEVVTEDPDAIAKRAADLSQQTSVPAGQAGPGQPVPLVAALSPQDFANVTDKVIRKSPEALASAQGKTGQYIKQFMDRMLAHVNNAGKLSPTTPDGALSATLGSLADQRSQTANDLMEPIRNTPLDLTQLPLSDLEAGVTRSIGGRIMGGSMPGQPSLGSRLRDALSPIDPDILKEMGVEPSDVSNINGLLSKWGMRDPVPATIGELDQLRRTLMAAGKSSQASNPANSLAFNNAGNSIRQFITDQAPSDVAQQYSNMIDAYAGHSRMMEGFKTAANGLTPESIEDDLLRSNLNTPEGKTGLAAGELYRQRAAVAQSPMSAINAARNYAAEGALTRPSSIADGAAQPGTVTSNMGDQSATGLANASAGETSVLNRMLDTDKLNQVASNDQGALSTSDIAHMALLPHAMPMTKASVIANMMGKVTGLNPAVASNIADKLYSANPADVAEAMTALRRGGMTQDAVQAMMGTTTPAGVLGVAAADQGAQVAGGGTTPAPAADGAPIETPAAPDDGGLTGEVTDDTPAGFASPQGVPADPNGYTYPQDMNPSIGAVDPDKSPFMPMLQHIYQTENPEFLHLAETLQQKESAGQQFDKSGKPLTSPKGAVGLMQLEPATAQQTAASIGVPYNPDALANDPTYNKLLGVATLGALAQRYGGDKQKAAAAYNAGPGAVDKAVAANPSNWLAQLPAETQDYAGDI